jgi:2-polyprenyl-3-methyl-5-hydroxy-6-metoxy-1,4-benzoquinol methylase
VATGRRRDNVMEISSERHFLKLAAAFVRGRYAQGHPVELRAELHDAPLDDLAEVALATIFQAGQAAGLEMHKFKRTMGLARVQRVFGVLRNIAPIDLLDIGSGRGASLWPLLDEFPALPVTAIDEDPIRARDLHAVHLGGVDRLNGHQMNATKLDFPAGAFDVVTALEVLEHIPSVPQALAEAVRVVRRFIVLSAPSQPDNNPGHIHLLAETTLLGRREGHVRLRAGSHRRRGQHGEVKHGADPQIPTHSAHRRLPPSAGR